MTLSKQPKESEIAAESTSPSTEVVPTKAAKKSSGLSAIGLKASGPRFARPLLNQKSSTCRASTNRNQLFIEESMDEDENAVTQNDHSLIREVKHRTMQIILQMDNRPRPNVEKNIRL